MNNYLKLENLEIMDLTKKGIIDGMKENWDSEIIYENLKEFINKNEIDVLLTFDNKGVSGHKNHISLFSSIFKNKKNLEKIGIKKIFVLESINIFRKYFLLLEIFFIVMKDIFYVVYDFFKNTNSLENYFVFYNFNLFVNWKCMSLHYSQFVWYRKLFVIFSRYTYVNTIKMIDFN